MPPHLSLDHHDTETARRAARRFATFLRCELRRGDLTAGLAIQYRDELEGVERISFPGLTSEHEADLARGAILLNVERNAGEYSCLIPDADISGRWLTLAVFADEDQAAAFCSGYCARRNQEVGR